MKFTGKRIAMALAVPLIIGLVSATAYSGVVYQADGKGGSSQCSYHKASGDMDGAKCGAKKAAAGCSKMKMKNGSCGMMKGAAAGCSGKASPRCSSMGGADRASGESCKADASSCPLNIVRADGALKVYLLGDVKRTGEWLDKLADRLSGGQGMEAEVFEAKDGSWIEIRPGSNPKAYARLISASSDPKECCKILCGSAGCPPRA